MGDAAKALSDAARMLAQISSTPRLDVELLMAHGSGISREALLLDLPKLDQPACFDRLLARRKAQEPIAHIIGEKEFWGIGFRVTPDVLIPRPDSELLIEESLRLFSDEAPAKILDLGTGCGALLLAALSEFPDAQGVGLDASAAALAIAHNNADDLGLSDRASFVLQDWTMPKWIDVLDRPFDLILINPPYVSLSATLSAEVANFEPHRALFAGKDGMDDYRTLMPVLAGLLSEGGYVLLEIGFDQAEPVSQLALAHGYHVDCKRDLGGKDRMLILRRQK